VGFHEQTGHAHGHGGAGQHRHHLALTAAAGALPPGSCTEWVASNTTGAPVSRMMASAAHVAHQVVVAKGHAAFAGHEVVFAQALFAGRSAGFVDHVFHVVRGQELALFDVHRLARLGHGVNEIGLAAQKGRGLQHIDHAATAAMSASCAHRSGWARRVLFDFGQNFQPLSMPGPRKVVPLERLALSKLLLKMKRDAQRGGHLFELTGGVHLQLLGLNDAGPAIKKKAVRPTSNPHKFHAPATSSWKLCLPPTFVAQRRLDIGVEQGWPSHGVDLNSGWNCTPMNQGCTAGGQLDHFGELFALGQRRNHQTGLRRVDPGN
jgi:hypothetical protein